MKIVKPAWVRHDGQPIFCIDIHPDGSRFATGGQGDNCGRIVIWNMKPVQEEQSENTESTHKILCFMENHLACVNCLRWSNNGKYLASGSDDNLVMIWQLARGQSSVGFGAKFECIEQWRNTVTLRGHSGDILDLAWSPKDMWLATASVDNSVVIWNASKLPEQLAVLKGHSSLVKGVAWDPVGKYLASQSEDKTLKIWRTCDWKEEKCIKKPFVECGGTTHVLRVSWSPDGHFIVTAHAMNNSGPTAQIVERGDWKTKTDFVGHRKAVTCTRFNDCLLRKQNEMDGGKVYVGVALGGKDRSLSVWLTSLQRPLVVVHDLFENTILDISWSKSGKEVMCCSSDGTVAYVCFKRREIGEPLDDAEHQEWMEEKYGKSMYLSSNGELSDPYMVIESASVLALQQQKAVETEKVKQRLPPPPPVLATPADVPSKQLETRLSDGRRRITPVFLEPPPDLASPPPFSDSEQQLPTFHNTSSDSAMDETRDNDLEDTPKVPDTSVKPTEKLDAPTPLQVPIPLLAKPPTQTALLPSSTIEKQRKPVEQPPAEVLRKKTAHTPKKPRRESPPPRVASTKRKATVRSCRTVDRVHLLPTPEAQGHLEADCDGTSLEVTNTNQRSIVKLKKDGNLVWQTTLASRILTASVSTHAFAVGLEDCHLYIWRRTGGLAVPAIRTSHPVHTISSSGRFILTVVVTGVLTLWDTECMEAVLSNMSVLDAVSATQFDGVSVTSSGTPVVSTNDGNQYAFHKAFGSWICLSNDLSSMISVYSSKNVSGPLARIQTQRQESDDAPAPTTIYDRELFLESQLCCAKALNSPTEYRHWLLTLTRFLCEQQREEKIRELCNELFVPSKGAPSFLQTRGHLMLHEMLQVIGTHVELQRLYSEFAEQVHLSDRFTTKS